MTPNDLKDKFELYRKWFRTLVVKEFLDLPTRYQEKFIVMAQKFLDDCKKVYEEGKAVKERIIEITVQRIVPEFLEEVMNNKDTYFVYGKCEGSEEEIKITFSVNRPRPKIGSKLYHTIFSIDEKVWYSSKSELLNKKDRS
jgi:hypothetical protein